MKSFFWHLFDNRAVWQQYRDSCYLRTCLKTVGQRKTKCSIENCHKVSQKSTGIKWVKCVVSFDPVTKERALCLMPPALEQICFKSSSLHCAVLYLFVLILVVQTPSLGRFVVLTPGPLCKADPWAPLWNQYQSSCYRLITKWGCL